jgi:hypothetical protein
MRGWIIDQLSFITKALGIKEAALACESLKQKDKTNPWSLYARIGSSSFSA